MKLWQKIEMKPLHQTVAISSGCRSPLPSSRFQVLERDLLRKTFYGQRNNATEEGTPP